MLNFGIIFVCKMCFNELGHSYFLQLGEKIAIVERMEFLIEAFFDFALDLLRTGLCFIFLHLI